MDGVYRIAQKTGVDLSSVADIYQKISRNAVQYGLDQKAALGITEALANAVRLSGSSSSASAAALLQFGQALSSGVLRGEELNSVMEQTPALAEAIARGMGRTTGELRKMGEEGQLAAKDVLAAIQHEAARLESEVASMVPTVEASLTRLKNAFVKQMGEEAAGGSRLAAQGVDALAANLDKTTQAVVTLGAVWAASRAVSIGTDLAAAAAGAGGLVGMVARLNPLMLIASGAVVAASVAYNDWADSARISTSSVAKDIDALASHIGRVSAQIATMSRSAADAALADARRARAVDSGALDKLKARYEQDYGGDKRQTSRNDIAARDALRAQIMQGENALQRLDAELAALETGLGQAGKKAVSDFYENFGSKTTKQVAEIAKLEKAWNAASASLAQQGDSAGLVRLSGEFSARRKEILNAGADEKKAAAEVAQATKEGWTNRLNAIKAGTAHELALLEQAHAAGVTAEEDYRADVYRKTVEGLGRQAAALQDQLDATKDQSERAKLGGDLAEIQAAALKAADGYGIALAKMDKARTDFFEGGRIAQGRAATEEADALLKAASAAEAENARIGATAERLAELTARRYDEQIAIKQEALDLARSSADRAGEAYAIEQQISALRRLKSAEVTRPALEKQAAAWDKFGNDIKSSVTDALYRGFEDGTPAAEIFINTVRNTFGAAGLKLGVEMVVDPVMNGARSLAGVGASASGGINAMDLLGIGSSATQAGGAGAGLYGAFAASSLGQSLGLSATTAELATGGMLVDTVGLTSLGAGIGAALPWVGGAIALASLLGSGPKEDPHNNADQSGVSISFGTAGAIGGTSANGNYANTPASWVAGQTSGNGRWADWSAMDSGTVAQIAAQRDAIVTLAREAAASLKLDAGLIRNAAASGNFATIDDALASFGDNVSLRLLPALGQFREGGEKLVATLARVVGGVRTFDKWSDALDLTLSDEGRTKTAKTRNAIYDKAALVRSLGGAQAADSALASYAAAAYSDEELQAMQLAQANDRLAETFGRLKLEVPDSEAELREIVKGFDQATVKGRAAFVSVVNVADAFKFVQDAADTAVQAAIDQAQATADTAAAIYEAMRQTAAQMDGVASFADGLGLARAGVLGIDTTGSRIDALKSRLADETDLQKQLDYAGQIKDLVVSRYETEKTAIEQNRDAWRAAAADVRGFAIGMRLSDLSPLTSRERLDTAASQYFARSSAAHGNDLAAMQGMSSAAEAYLREGRSHWATSPEFVSIFNVIEQDMASLGIAADTTDTWQDQLLTIQTRATDEIDNLVSVTETMGTHLENALLAQAQEFAALRVPLDKMVGNTSGLDARIAAAVAAVLTRTTLRVTDSGALELARQNLYTTRAGQQVPP